MLRSRLVGLEWGRGKEVQDLHYIIDIFYMRHTSDPTFEVERRYRLNITRCGGYQIQFTAAEKRLITPNRVLRCEILSNAQLLEALLIT